MSTSPDQAARTKRKERTRQQLITSAARLFAEQGYDAVPVDSVALDAGVARQTFFNYFPSKRDVVLAWVEQRRDTVLDGLRAVDDGPALDRLARGLDAVAALYDADAAVSRPMVRTWIRSGGPVLPGADATAVHLADVIRHGQSAGEIRTDVSATEAAHFVLDVYLGALYRWAGSPGETLSATLRTPVDLALTALRRDPSG